MKKESKNLFRLYPVCIFCNTELSPPEKRVGEGEHVIPESIFGFWRSYDVCPECIKYFGDNVDHLAIKNPNILQSMELLNIKDVEKHYEQMKYLGEDVFSKVKKTMIRRNGGYKTKTTIKPNFIECSENDFDPIVGNDFKRQFASKLSPEEIERELKKIKDTYFSLNPGESFVSPLVGEIRKSQLSNIEYDFESIPSIIPLIAKVAFLSIHYFIPIKYLSNFIEYESYRKQARYNIPIREYSINYCVLRKTETRHPFHFIRFIPSGHFLYIDVTFFGYNNWRCVLPFTEEIILDDGETAVDKFSFYLDFSDVSNKKKYLAFHYPDGSYKEIEIFA